MVQEISYADKISLVTSALPNENKVRDADMNEIKSVTNNNAAILNNNLTYSSTEKNTGKTWIDGKEIYRTMVEVDLTSEHSTNYSYTHDIADIDNITSIDGILKRSADAGWISINSYSANSYRISVVGTKTTLNIQNVGYVGTAYYIVEYTKSE